MHICLPVRCSPTHSWFSTAIRKPQANHCGLILYMWDLCRIIQVCKLFSGSGEKLQRHSAILVELSWMMLWLPTHYKIRYDNLSRQDKGTYSSASQKCQKAKTPKCLVFGQQPSQTFREESLTRIVREAPLCFAVLPAGCWRWLDRLVTSSQGWALLPPSVAPPILCS